MVLTAMACHSRGERLISKWYFTHISTDTSYHYTCCYKYIYTGRGEKVVGECEKRQGKERERERKKEKGGCGRGERRERTEK